MERKDIGVRVTPEEVEKLRPKVEQAVTDGRPWVVINIVAGEIFLDELKFCQTRAAAMDQCWFSELRGGEWYAVPASTLNEALATAKPVRSTSVDEMIELGLPSEHLATAEDSQKAANYLKLSDQMTAIGISDDFTEWELKAGLLLGGESFDIKSLSSSPSKDIVQYVFHFEKNEAGHYVLQGFDGTLRKASPMPDQRARQLEEKMHVVDWDAVLFGEQLPVETLPRFMQEIVHEVDALSASGRAGFIAADNLRYRYWSGTVLDELMPNKKDLKDVYHAGHFFPATFPVTTLTAAYKLLRQLYYEMLRSKAKPLLIELNNSNLKFMEKDNVEFLKDNLKYMGFGEKLNSQLDEQIAKGAKDFQIKDQRAFDNGRNLDLTLHYNRSEKSGNYFFNKFDARLAGADANQNGRSQTFYTSDGITLKEAYNLLDGRFINKDFTSKDENKYNAWANLDFAQTDKNGNHVMRKYTEGYGFNAERQLSKLPVVEADPSHPNHSRTMYSLKKGNLTEVHTPDSQKYFIAANPPKNRMDVYDSQGKVVDLKKDRGQEQGASNTMQNGAQPGLEQNQQRSNGRGVGKERAKVAEGEAPAKKRGWFRRR